MAYANFLGPLLLIQRGAVEGNELITAAIIRLLFGRCPPDIPWFVVPVVVRPTGKRFSFRWVANITVEPLEVMPLFSDCNPAAAIRRISIEGLRKINRKLCWGKMALLRANGNVVKDIRMTKIEEPAADAP